MPADRVEMPHREVLSRYLTAIAAMAEADVEFREDTALWIDFLAALHDFEHPEGDLLAMGCLCLMMIQTEDGFAVLAEAVDKLVQFPGPKRFLCELAQFKRHLAEQARRN